MHLDKSSWDQKKWASQPAEGLGKPIWGNPTAPQKFPGFLGHEADQRFASQMTFKAFSASSSIGHEAMSTSMLYVGSLWILELHSVLIE